MVARKIDFAHGDIFLAYLIADRVIRGQVSAAAVWVKETEGEQCLRPRDDLYVLQVQAGILHFSHHAPPRFVIADLADRQGVECLPKQGSYIMGDDMQLAIIPPVDEMAAATFFAAQGMLPIQQEECSAADSPHSQHGPVWACWDIHI